MSLSAIPSVACFVGHTEALLRTPNARTDLSPRFQSAVLKQIIGDPDSTRVANLVRRGLVDKLFRALPTRHKRTWRLDALDVAHCPNPKRHFIDEDGYADFLSERIFERKLPKELRGIVCVEAAPREFEKCLFYQGCFQDLPVQGLSQYCDLPKPSRGNRIIQFFPDLPLLEILWDPSSRWGRGAFRFAYGMGDNLQEPGIIPRDEKNHLHLLGCEIVGVGLTHTVVDGMSRSALFAMEHDAIFHARDLPRQNRAYQIATAALYEGARLYLDAAVLARREIDRHLDEMANLSPAVNNLLDLRNQVSAFLHNYSDVHPDRARVLREVRRFVGGYESLFKEHAQVDTRVKKETISEIMRAVRGHVRQYILTD